MGWDKFSLCRVEGLPPVLDRLRFWTASLGQMCPTANLSTGHCPVPPQAGHRSVCCKDTEEDVQQVTGRAYVPPAPMAPPAVTAATPI